MISKDKQQEKMDKKDKEELKFHCEQIAKLLKKNSSGADKDLYEGEKFLIQQFKETVHPNIGEFFFKMEQTKEQ